ncbi:uncharacterized protein BJ171DRAFT_194111 [Polychytrium aggregatum]|uniref:uncharacterized protein n=1 Tax=Polychytrium aggregatum TaxID=110093 RepID=UPI0022FEA9EA|nr:uncharacterized protein BJ171DRAFT_194111 [Polychytrium aggregatum]KAI9202003.1 hypothetical protein BJ171DRAFT_194111 [Polychytrium aggregatum]
MQPTQQPEPRDEAPFDTKVSEHEDQAAVPSIEQSRAVDSVDPVDSVNPADSVDPVDPVDLVRADLVMGPIVAPPRRYIVDSQEEAHEIEYLREQLIQRDNEFARLTEFMLKLPSQSDVDRLTVQIASLQQQISDHERQGETPPTGLASRGSALGRAQNGDILLDDIDVVQQELARVRRVLGETQGECTHWKALYEDAVLQATERTMAVETTKSTNTSPVDTNDPNEETLQTSSALASLASLQEKHDMLVHRVSELGEIIRHRDAQLEDSALREDSLKHEIQVLRRAQVDYGSLLLQGKDATTAEVFAALNAKCRQLADEVSLYQVQAREQAMLIETLKTAVHNTEILERRISDQAEEITKLNDATERLRYTSKLKEEALLTEVKRFHSHNATTEDRLYRLWQIAVEPGSKFDPERVVLDEWLAEWMAMMKEKVVRLQAVIDSSEAIIAKQHDKLIRLMEEQPTKKSAASPSFGSDPSPPEETPAAQDASRPTDSHRSTDAGTQTDPMMAFTRISTIKAELLSNLETRSSASASTTGEPSQMLEEVLESGEGSHVATQPPATPLQLSPQGSSRNLEAGGRDDKSTTEADKIRAKLKKLAVQYTELQNVCAGLEDQVAYQIQINNEMKQLIARSSLGIGRNQVNEAHELLERYNDALVQVGLLRLENERWRARCEELEEVVESIVMQQTDPETD